METVHAKVGLDYATAFLQLCIMDPEGRMLENRKCGNDWREVHAAVVAKCGERVVVEAAIESCNGAADLAEELVSQAGWSVSLAHPGFVSRMKQNPDKTDWHDSRLLADLIRVKYLPRVWLAPGKVREFRRLVRFRRQLCGQRRDTKLRLGAMLREQRCRPPAKVTPWTKPWLAWLKGGSGLSEAASFVAERSLALLEHLAGEIRAVEKRLERLSEGDAIVARLLELPGVGPVTAWTLRAEVGRFDRFRNGKQLARFCGLSPCNASSGQKTADAGLIKAANPDLRAVLIEAAHRLARHDGRWKEFATGLRARGKPGSLVAAAVANRWIRWLYHRMAEVEKTLPAEPKAA